MKVADGISITLSVKDMTDEGLRELRKTVNDEIAERTKDFVIHRGGNDFKMTPEDYEPRITYNIWSKAYLATGNWNGQPTFHGTVSARNFRAACDKLFLGSPDYNPESPSLYGCSLYDGARPGLMVG